MSKPEGKLYVDKPAGWTSFDVVNYIRRIVADLEGKKPRNIKVGHSGTLDPAATGLLTVCVGKTYTKQMPTLIKQDKTYEVEMTLGATSTTGDGEGELTAVKHEQPDARAVQTVIMSFVGESMQTPPAFSAIKVDGKRAYDLARAGKPVELQARSVRIDWIRHISYQYPRVTFTVRVSSGTYIRSLVEDIGARLGSGAYMSALRRTSIGDVSLDQAVGVKQIAKDNLVDSLAP